MNWRTNAELGKKVTDWRSDSKKGKKVANWKSEKGGKKKVDSKDVSRFLTDAMEYLAGLSMEIAAGVTFDTSNLLAAKIDAIIGDGDFDKALEIIRDRRDDFADKHPGSAAIANIAGAMRTGGGLVQIATKGAQKLINKNIPSLIKAVGGAGIASGESVVSEHARRGEKGEIGKAAIMGLAGGSIGAMPYAWASVKKANAWAFRALGPSSSDLSNLGTEASERIGHTMLVEHILRWYRGKSKMLEVMKGTSKVDDLMLYDPDAFKYIDAEDVVKEGLISTKSKEINKILKDADDIWWESKGGRPKSIKSMEGGDIKHLKQDILAPIQAKDIGEDIVEAIQKEVNTKKIYFLDKTSINQSERILKKFMTEKGMDISEAHQLKKTFGGMLTDKAWLESSDPGKRDMIKRVYIQLKTAIEDKASEISKNLNSPKDWGESIRETNKQLSSLIVGGKLLQKSSSRESLRKIGLFDIYAGGAGLTVAAKIDPDLAGIGAILGVATKKFVETRGPQVMATLHKKFATGSAGTAAVAFSKTSQELFDNDVQAAEGPQFIPRKKDDLKLNLPLIKSIVEQEAPHLTTELVNSAMHDDDETFIQILSDLAPEMENFVEQPPLKIKNIPMKSSFYSPTYEGEIRVGNDIEKNQVTEHIMNKEDITQKEKLAMVSQFIERSTITPEKPKEDQGLNQVEGLDSALREKRSLMKKNPQVY